MVKKVCVFMATVLLSTVVYAQQKVLFVMSSAGELPLQKDKVYKETGVFLSEFFLAYKEIADLGYEIDIATPDGNKPFIDKESLNKKYWGDDKMLLPEALDFVRDNKEFNHPRTIDHILQNNRQYIGMVVPGGQGLMVDLIKDYNTSQLLVEFSKQGKPIGLICHAPALILSIPKEENPFIGYEVNSVTGLEEWFIESFVMKGKPFNRKIGRQLKKLGLKYKKGRPAGNFAIRDRELITSQNPYSNQTFITLYIEALKEYESTGSLRFSQE
ncbi:MAG: DJ-1/PfpI family protein [Flavobacteriaceae bacterium]